MAPWANRPGIKEPNDEDENTFGNAAARTVARDISYGSGANQRQQRSAAGVAVVARYVRLAIVVIGIAIIAQSSAGFERTRRAIDRDEVMQMPQSRVESLLSAVLAIAVVIGAFTFVPRDSSPNPDRRALWI